MIGLFARNLENVWFGVACDENRVFATSFAKSREDALSSLLDCLPFNAPFEAFSKTSAFADKILTTMKDVYDGKDISNDIPFVYENMSPYNRKVLEVTAKIPVGFVASYGAVAKAAGGSPRSVGNAMAANPFAPIVPCHRVVKSDLTLGCYGGGKALKREMLIREKRGYKAKMSVLIDGKKLVAFPVEFLPEMRN